jgi:hypothetical protein
MTKRLSLWGPQLSPNKRGTDGPCPTDPPPIPAATTARFYAKRPDLLRGVASPDELLPEPPTEIDDAVTLEAGSWETQGLPEPLAREDLPDRRRGKKIRRVPRHKTRRHAVSIAVSEEEERIVRTYAAGLNKSFSEWSRTVLFRAMGRRVPSRSGKEEDEEAE